ncbi:AraC family transcriptional regulator [Aliidongia dinghuensis]|uniref:AraC family transcriptional regulator n=1 Tax=Aliidongia dinghuensis TaxID=1867774 RepID=UPI001E4D8E8B|nr:AraC family transcriptional regulator [Aliidongia dinghuensis]
MSARIHRAIQHRSPIVGIEVLSLTSNLAFPRHVHDHLGIGVIAEGGHRSWSDIGAVEAVAGEIIMVNPGEMHDGLPVAGHIRSWRMLCFEPDLVARELADETPHLPDAVLPMASDPMLAARFLRLFERMREAAPEALAVEEGVLATLMQVMRRHASRPIAVDRRSPVVAKAQRRIDEAPELPVTLAELAALAGTSRFQLLRGFARELGITPHAYLVTRRVGLARRLIRAGHALADVAAAAGFADQSHLNRAFVRQCGVTPGRYRAALA